MILIMDPWVQDKSVSTACKAGDGAAADSMQEITPQLVKAACNVISQYCDQQGECYECAIYQKCSHSFRRVPNAWVKEE